MKKFVFLLFKGGSFKIMPWTAVAGFPEFLSLTLEDAPDTKYSFDRLSSTPLSGLYLEQGIDNFSPYLINLLAIQRTGAQISEN